MRPDKFSVSAAEALQATMGIAADAQAPAMAPIHMLFALLDSGERNIDAIIEHIGTLRTKLDEAGALIQTVRGVGYKLEKSDEQ